MEYVIRGLIIGLIIGIPLEQAAEMLVQNATRKGVKSCIWTGVGTALAYLILASIDVLLVSFFSKYIIKTEPYLGYAVGGLIIIFGMFSLIRNENNYDTDNSDSNNFMNAMNGFMLGFTNKYALVLIFYLYIFFDIGRINFKDGIRLAVSTAVGAFAWCIIIGVISWIVGRITEIKKIRIYLVFSNLFVMSAGAFIILYKLM